MCLLQTMDEQECANIQIVALANWDLKLISLSKIFFSFRHSTFILLREFSKNKKDKEGIFHIIHKYLEIPFSMF